jgi:hypothetical protein
MRTMRDELKGKDKTSQRIYEFSISIDQVPTSIDGIETLINRNDTLIDEGFPAAVSETWIEGMISALENSRQAYDMNVSQGKQLNAAYTSNFKGNGKNIGRVNTMLYGFFGKKNTVINDFGLRPFKSNKLGSKKTS